MRDKTFLQDKLRELKAEYKRLKAEVGTKKLLCNGTFGKLGSPYSAFYSPDLMLAVTMTGQLNLMCLIYDLEFNPQVKVLSANTDGIMVQYPASLRDRVVGVIVENAKRTGYEYEETCYRKVALANVNNYIAITDSRVPVIISPDGEVVDGKGSGGKAKRKGLFAKTSLMKNPTHEVCSNMAADFLTSGIHPSVAINNYKDMTDFVAIRNVKGGGIQYDAFEEVDDWVLIDDKGTKDNAWFRQAWIDEGFKPDFDSGPGTGVPANSRKPVLRKSRPKPVQIGVGGQYFGRIARWYMQKDGVMPINYAGSGNRVPKTDGAKLCMTLPPELPADLDLDWYVVETISMLGDMGVVVDETPSSV